MKEHPTLGGSFEEIGKDMRNIRESVPHVYIGGSGMTTEKPGDPPRVPQQSMPEDEFDKKINKLKNWALVISVCLVLGYAAYRLLMFFMIK